MQYYQQGFIKPIHPLQAFAAQQVAEAFRHMQKGHHIGKILIAMLEIAADISAVKTPQNVTLSDKFTYLLAGGLGGLGKAVTTWMAEHGAKSFVFLSRSAAESNEDLAFLREIESQGCRAIAIAGNVAELGDVKRAVQAAPTRIAGVIQLSMVMRVSCDVAFYMGLRVFKNQDLPLLQTGHSDWNAVQDPKVKGTWNLHEALLGVDLAFFILCSSISGVYGHPGQASYASANTFLGSFVQYRHSINLPCSVIDIGFLEGVGYISRNTALRNKLLAIGNYPLQEQDLLDAIQLSIGKNPSDMTVVGSRNGYIENGHIVIGLRSSKPLSEPSNHIVWKRDIRMGQYRQLESTNGRRASSKNEGRLQHFLDSVGADPDALCDPSSLSFVSQEIGRTICGFMLLPEDNVDIGMTLDSMGVDSLVSIEIRNWLYRALRVKMSVLEIMNAGTIESLGEKVVALLQEEHKKA